jgi:hypothetical protein
LPIKRELRWFYPDRLHASASSVPVASASSVPVASVRGATWRNGRGRLARWPDIEEAVKFRQTRDSACGPRRLCAMLTMAEPLASVA